MKSETVILAEKVAFSLRKTYYWRRLRSNSGPEEFLVKVSPDNQVLVLKKNETDGIYRKIFLLPTSLGPHYVMRTTESVVLTSMNGSTWIKVILDMDEEKII